MRARDETAVRLLLVERNRRLAACGQDEHVVIIESVQKPKIVPDHAPHVRSSQWSRVSVPI